MYIPSALKSRDAAAIAVLVIMGFAYYSRYYDYGFNTGDEGSFLLLTMRILGGERPYADLVLGYGLLWYYPLALLFKITGVSFLVARIYLLSLAMLGALLAYLAVRKQTRIRALAFNVALLILALPGDLQNIYIPLVVLANMLAVSTIDLDRQALAGRQVTAAGLVVGISWFVRAELALGATAVLIAILTAHTIFSSPLRRWPRRLGRLSALAMGGAALPALPLLLVAYGQGFGRQLLHHMAWPFRILLQIPTLARTNRFVEPAPPAAGATEEVGATLARVPLGAAWEEGPARILAILTYLPLLTLALIGAGACLRMLRHRRRGRSPIGNDSAGILALLGLTVTAFPQFFLFRPDPAHLSFFMPGYCVLAAVCLGRWVLPKGRAAREEPAAAPQPAFRPPALAFGALLVAHVGLYFSVGLGTPTTGSMIALAKGRTERFLGKNGVEVAVTPIERYLFDKVTRIVEAHTDEDDVLLCFPFGPGWNVLTDRGTFARTLYVDDTMMGSPWQQTMLEGIRRERPPVIIVDNWPINGTELSRFKNWATQIMAHLASEYVVLDSVGSLEIYGLKETAR